ATVKDNKFIDTYGIHFYNSGGNCVVSGNYIEPFLENGLAVGESLFLCKNQNLSDGRNIFSDNIVNGTVTQIFHSTQTYAQYLTDNTFINLTANRYIISTTSFIDKRKAYIIGNSDAALSN